MDIDRQIEAVVNARNVISVFQSVAEHKRTKTMDDDADTAYRELLDLLLELRQHRRDATKAKWLRDLVEEAGEETAATADGLVEISSHVYIIDTRSDGWAIVPDVDLDFWLHTEPTYKRAVEFCVRIGWIIGDFKDMEGEQP